MKKKAIASKAPAKASLVVEIERPPTPDDPHQFAKYLEKEQKFDDALKIYQKLLKTEHLRESTYQRMMLIYRKKADYKNELRIIDAGIKAFQDLYRPSAVGKHRSIVTLSKKLNVLIGLTDEKGKMLNDAEPIRKWKKRREIVLGKMKKKKK